MATFIRKLFGHFVTTKDDLHRKPVQRPERAGGFAVRDAVPAETSIHVPVVSQSAYANGGVQGLKWYSEKLRIDDDGDVAQEFLSEVVPECWEAQNAQRPLRLESVVKTRPAILKGPVSTQDGNVHQYVESSSGDLWA